MDGDLGGSFDDQCITSDHNYERNDDEVNARQETLHPSSEFARRTHDQVRLIATSTRQ